MTAISFTLNGDPVNLDVAGETPLIYVLRNQCHIASVRYGCGQEQCGACVLHVDGKPAHACTLPTQAVADAVVTTLEGLGTSGALHPLQQAFLDLNAAQCGFCTSGIVMTAAALLEHNPAPTRSDIQQALAGHLCRCGAHNRVIQAVLRTAVTLAAKR
jgi:nicotinate dehydrogenase subunit A